MDQSELHRYALDGLRARLDEIDAERQRIVETIASIEGTPTATTDKAKSRRERWLALQTLEKRGFVRVETATTTTPTGRPRRKMSAAGRAAISAAQRERWARQRRIEDVAPVADAVVVEPKPTKTRKRKTTRKATKAAAAPKPKMPRLVKARKTKDDSSSVPF